MTRIEEVISDLMSIVKPGDHTLYDAIAFLREHKTVLSALCEARCDIEDLEKKSAEREAELTRLRRLEAKLAGHKMVVPVEWNEFGPPHKDGYSELAVYDGVQIATATMSERAYIEQRVGVIHLDGDSGQGEGGE